MNEDLVRLVRFFRIFCGNRQTGAAQWRKREPRPSSPRWREPSFFIRTGALWSGETCGFYLLSRNRVPGGPLKPSFGLSGEGICAFLCWFSHRFQKPISVYTGKPRDSSVTGIQFVQRAL